MLKVFQINFLFILFLITKKVDAQIDFLEKLMKTEPENFQQILNNSKKYEVQILYTQIDRNQNNVPIFKTFSYHVNDSNYFYPASTVKLPASILALEKINDLNINGLTKESEMLTKVGFEKHTEALLDSSSKNGKPSIEQYIKKILLVSDNDAFNRLYEFIGQYEINKKLKDKGFTNTRIVHRLQASINVEQNKNTNPIEFYNNGQIIYKQAAKYNSINYFPKKAIKRGIGYLDTNNVFINEPFDFTQKNKFALTDQHNMLKTLFFPNSVKKKSRFHLSKDDYQFLYKYMSKLPTESSFPNYHSPEYWPTYCKFALFGSEKNIDWPKNIRVFNKVGDAYGFLIDNAYIVDFDAGIEFMLSAVIYCNEDEIYNDNKYEYDTIGLPFMKNLGKLLFDFELKRQKKIKPNLQYLKFDYSN